MKFRKGESGDPGSPKVLGEVQELARQHAPSAIAELARLAQARNFVRIKIKSRGGGIWGRMLMGINTPHTTGTCYGYRFLVQLKIAVTISDMAPPSAG